MTPGCVVVDPDDFMGNVIAVPERILGDVHRSRAGSTTLLPNLDSEVVDAMAVRKAFSALRPKFALV